MRGKPVKILALVVFSAHTLLALDLEGSGDFGLDDTLLDQEDGDLDDGFDNDEGSGDSSWQIDFGDSPFKHTADVSSSSSDDYYYDTYDYLDAQIDSDETFADDYLFDYEDRDNSGVLRIEEDAEVEIDVKPTDSEEEQIVLNTSQIFIMVGSSFISFAIFMLTFFLCRRIISNKQRKAMAYTSTPEKLPAKEPPIVKDYQKVPTTTQEILRSKSPQRLNMYGGGDDPENP